MKCKSSYLHRSLELNAEKHAAQPREMSPGQVPKTVRESSPSQEDLWYPLVEWLRAKLHLKGARLIFQSMDAWAGGMNILQNIFGLSPQAGVHCNLLADFPVLAKSWDMTDQKTIHECFERIRTLENKLEREGLDASETAELKTIKKYLRESSYRGKPKPFADEMRRAIKRNRQAVHYTLCILNREDPELADYAKKHLRTSPVIHWLG